MIENSALKTPAISVIVTAPHGISKCLYLDAYLAMEDAQSLEIIVVDEKLAGDAAPDQRVRHISAKGRTVQGLIAAGLRHASHDWILITEDHCLPMADVVTRYRAAIMKHPAADIFAGSVDNLTSTSPWSDAAYKTGLGAFWPETTVAP